MSNQDVYNTPQNPWSFPQRPSLQAYARQAYAPQAEEPATQPQQPQPQQPPAQDDYGQSVGTFTNLPEAQPTQQPAMPTGQPQRPYQRYVSSATDRPPSEWGTPDWALAGAENYPGVPPGPYMPQAQDMWGTVQSVITGLGQGGSGYVQQSANMMGVYGGRMSKAYVEGQLAGYKLNFAKLQQQLTETAVRQKEELDKYRELFAIFGPHKDKDEEGKETDNPGDPQRLHDEIAGLAHHYNDETLKAALESGGVAAAERVLATRDGHSQDAEKVLKMQKLQLEVEKLKAETEKIKKQGAAIDTETAPPEEADEPLPGEEKPPTDITTPDRPDELDRPGPDQPTQTPPPDAQPQPPTGPTSGDGRQGAIEPPAPSPTQVAGGQAPGTATDAPAPGVSGGAQPQPTTAGRVLPAPKEPEPSPPSQESQERSPPYQDGGPSKINDILRPVPDEKMPRGFSRERLDQLARWYLEHKKEPFGAGDPLRVERNEAVMRRASQMEARINQILDSKNLNPQQKIRLLGLIDPGLTRQAQAIANDVETMPRASGSDYNRLLSQIVPIFNPGYVQTDPETRKKFKGDYTPGGYAGKAVSSASRLAEAARAVVETTNALPDLDVSRALAGFNAWLQTGTGDPRYTNFYAAWRGYIMEAVRLQRGGQGAEADIRAGIEMVPVASSKAQIFGFLQQETRTAAATLDYYRNLWKQQNMPGEMPGYDKNNYDFLHDVATGKIKPGTTEAPQLDPGWTYKGTR